jgi:hypothetical protein
MSLRERTRPGLGIIEPCISFIEMVTLAGLEPATSERRFPPPWSVEELDACFVVTDKKRA